MNPMKSHGTGCPIWRSWKKLRVAGEPRKGLSKWIVVSTMWGTWIFPPFSPVLAVGAWLAEVNLSDVVVYVLSAAGYVLPIGLHVELLDVCGKAEEGLSVG